MYTDVHCIKGLFAVFLTMAEVAGIPICMKDFISYETGEWKCLELFLFFTKKMALPRNKRNSLVLFLE